jgi:hypothetical protein
MRDLIPLQTPSNTWRGFALRVVVIALAASIVLGIASLFGWSFDTLGSHPRPVSIPTETHTTQP